MYTTIKNFVMENRFLFFIIFNTILVSLSNINAYSHKNEILLLLVITILFSIFMDKVGHILQLISISRLSNQLNDSNLKLKKSENRFRELFNQTHIPMCIFNLKTKKFIKCNRYLCEILGYSEKELQSLNIENLIIKEDYRNSIDVINLNLKKQKLSEFSNRYITKSGEIINIKWTFTQGDEEGISYCVASKFTLDANHKL